MEGAAWGLALFPRPSSGCWCYPEFSSLFRDPLPLGELICGRLLSPSHPDLWLRPTPPAAHQGSPPDSTLRTTDTSLLLLLDILVLVEVPHPPGPPDPPGTRSPCCPPHPAPPRVFHAPSLGPSHCPLSHLLQAFLIAHLDSLRSPSSCPRPSFIPSSPTSTRMPERSFSNALQVTGPPLLTLPHGCPVPRNVPRISGAPTALEAANPISPPPSLRVPPPHSLSQDPLPPSLATHPLPTSLLHSRMMLHPHRATPVHFLCSSALSFPPRTYTAPDT